MRAPDILTRAADEMRARGKQRDTPEGERSMARTVASFNALTGLSLTEAQGWVFMCCLKLARGTSNSTVLDDTVDLAAYAALWGECTSPRVEQVYFVDAPADLPRTIREIDPKTDLGKINWPEGMKPGCL